MNASVIAAIAAAEVPVPTLGYETPAGLPIAVSWPDHRIAVDLDLEPEDQTELSDEGWLLVAPEVPAIKESLASLGTN